MRVAGVFWRPDTGRDMERPARRREDGRKGRKEAKDEKIQRGEDEQRKMSGAGRRKKKEKKKKKKRQRDASSAGLKSPVARPLSGGE